MFPTAFEALAEAVRRWDVPALNTSGFTRGKARQFVEGANEVFAEEQVSWTYVDGQMIEMKTNDKRAKDKADDRSTALQFVVRAGRRYRVAGLGHEPSIST